MRRLGVSGARAFTLLEVLYSLTILSFFFLWLATIFPTGYHTMRKFQVRENAMREAQIGAEFVKTLSYDSLTSLTSPYFEPIDVDGDGMLYGNEYRNYTISVDSPRPGMTTVVISVHYLAIPHADVNPKDGEWDTETQSIVLYVDRYF
jgi:type II secretory pathway pseudopilin PulG